MNWSTLALLFGCCFSCRAQAIQIDSGSLSDQFVTGGSTWTQATLGADPTLRYGPSFFYSIPTKPGLYDVTITLEEPNQTAAGRRLMSISGDSFLSGSLDVFQLAGGMNRPFAYHLTLRSSGTLTLRFTGILGNAILSSLSLSPISLDVTFQAPITFGPRCERDGERQFNLSSDGILCICILKQPNPVWMCLPQAFIQKQ